MNNNEPTAATPESTPEGATFEISPDDPLSVQQRGGIAADAGNEGKAGMLTTDDNTAGLISPGGQPGGSIGDTASRTGATAPAVEMTDIGLTDVNSMDNSVTGDDENRVLGDADVKADKRDGEG